MVTEIMLVAAGGAVGCVCRYGMEHLGWFADKVYHTVLINVIGCLLIGVLWTVIDRCAGNSSSFWSRLLVTGLLGGFTTFSAFSLHPVLMMRSGQWIEAVAYVTVTVAGGLAACALGMYAAEKIIRTI